MIATNLRPSQTLYAAPRILLTATLRWPIAARLAIAFAELGCHVEAICPSQHPIAKTRSIGRTYRYPLLKPLGALRAAIESAAPDQIIPCDDTAAVHLHQLYLCTGEGDASASALRKLIARSLGAPGACSLATMRGKFIALAAEEGVRVPATAVVETSTELDAWLANNHLPAVIKIDSTCGGQGVAVVRTRDEAQRAFSRMAARPSIRNALLRMFLERDGSFLLNSLQSIRRAVSVQTFIQGVPANRAVACWRGEVLGGISVQAIETQHATGPATVVRVIEHPEMAEATQRLVRRLGVSGLWGVDFVIAEGGAAYVIEMNPRATPICHLRLGSERDLPAALCAHLSGKVHALRPVTIDRDVIALFPGEWHRNSASQYLRTEYHDIPWDEPRLIQDCIDKPWSERGTIARLWSHVRRAFPRRPSGLRNEQRMKLEESKSQLQTDGEHAGL